MNTAQEVRHSKTYDVAITTGLIAYGVVHLLTALAVGIAAFGGYCFIWSRNARR